MKMRVSVNVAEILRRRGLGDSDRARILLASEVARLSDPYVPMQSGALKNSSQIENGGRKLIYPGPYAHYQYEGEVMAGTAPKQYTGKSLTYQGAPMRGKQWDKRMMADRGGDLTRRFAKLIGGKPK